MATPTRIVIESAEGVYTLVKGGLGPETLQIERSVDRPPLSDAWYDLGDGKFNPSTLQVTARISRGTIRQSITELNEFMRIAEAATLLRWGEYRREVFGLTGSFVKTPIALGYRLTLTFAPKGPKWLDEFGDEVYL